MAAARARARRDSDPAYDYMLFLRAAECQELYALLEAAMLTCERLRAKCPQDAKRWLQRLKVLQALKRRVQMVEPIDDDPDGDAEGEALHDPPQKP